VKVFRICGTAFASKVVLLSNKVYVQAFDCVFNVLIAYCIVGDNADYCSVQSWSGGYCFRLYLNLCISDLHIIALVFVFEKSCNII